MEPIQKTEKHWGSYDSVDHGYDERSKWASAARQQGVGQSPFPGVAGGATPDLRAVVAPEVRGNLQYVRQDLAPMLRSILNMTEFVPEAGPGVVRGTAKVAPIPPAQPWLESAIANGGAVLLELASVQEGKPIFVIDNEPANIAVLANAGQKPPVPAGQFVIVSISPQTEAAARSAAGPQAPPPEPGPPPPDPGGAIPEPFKKTPMDTSTALLVGVGVVGAIALAGVIMSKEK